MKYVAWVQGAIRFTLGRYNTPEEISLVVDTLARIVENLRKKLVRRGC